MRHSRWFWLAFSASLMAASAGCEGEAQLKIETPKPAPAPPPPADADGDGVLDDGTDKCVAEKEDGLPPDAKDGCKTTDPDKDGIAGDTDKCPSEAEVVNKF